MAEMKIIVQKIDRIEEHPNADRLEIAFTDIYDWPIIVGKDTFIPGDKVIHFPVDCVISQELENVLLGGSKIKLSKGRIRAAKIRGIVSYGILSQVAKLQEYHSFDKMSKDLMKGFGCKKYEPPIKSANTQPNTQKKSWKFQNRNFSKYFNMNHLQNCKGIFKDEDVVVVTEKLHGSSFRSGWVKRDVVTWWEKFKLSVRRLIDKESEWEFVFGSRNVQLQDKGKKDNFYKENIYSKMVDKYNLKNLPKGIVVYAEIVGPGVQKNYQYTKDHEMFVYDIKKDGKYIDHFDIEMYSIQSYLTQVPIIKIGIPWSECKEFLRCKFGKSILDPSQKIIEGFVVSLKEEEICGFGRKKVKVLNPDYLLNKTNTDFH